ncbi:MAG: molybdopterin-dependent oxidoreductase [Polyangia bacterium]|jgi:CO/xanthine dehydrogenase Mo-binding subunit|nr:molybdopterin-dependent oxidoreductase [Polyangia bacterium]
MSDSSQESKRWNVVNHPVTKIDAAALAAGAPLFCDDELPPGTLFGAVKWSPVAHARILRIDTSKAAALPGVQVILTHENVPRVVRTTAGQGFPEPSPYDFTMLDRKVRFVGDRVAAVAADTREIARHAIELIEVEYEELPAIMDARQAMADGAPVIHDEPEARMIIVAPYEPARNLAAHVKVAVGDLQAGLESAATRVIETYEAHYAQHCPIEPHITIAWQDGHGRLMVRTSTQVPFHARRIVAQACEIPVRDVRVIKPRIGGGFGAKQEVLIEDLAAMLALRAGRPVKLEYTRSEEFISARTRHPAHVTIDLGLDPEGRFVGLDMKVLLNTGAYGAHALTVGCNCGSKVLPLYQCANVGFELNAVYTNLPVGGAYRGYGATQAAFALESAIDEAAAKLGLCPLEVRRKNHIGPGDTSPIFKVLGEGTEGVEQSIGSCGLSRCIDLGAEAIGWTEKRARRDEGRRRRGVGMCCLMQGSSIPEVDMGAASLKMNEDGSFNLLVGATDLGTGSDTVLAQIAAETLNTDVEQMIVLSSDTDITPFDVGAYASSTTYLSGMAVQKAAAGVRRQILEVASQILELPMESLHTANGAVLGPDGKSVSFSEVAIRSLYGKNQHQIQAVASHISEKSPPPFSAHFAEVEVDTATGLVRVLKYVSAVDCGTAINPQLAEGQIEGATLNGICYALTERYLFSSRGKMRNPSFKHYKIFGPADLPELVTILVPTYEPTGPYGAKSVSEICINGPLPALANAIFHATGVRLRRGPFSPEAVLSALAGRPL